VRTRTTVMVVFTKEEINDLNFEPQFFAKGEKIVRGPRSPVSEAVITTDDDAVGFQIVHEELDEFSRRHGPHLVKR